jgi:lysyl-tRNA synthetase class 2
MPIKEIRKIRINKLNILKKNNIDPYPIKSERNYTLDQVIKESENLIKSKKSVVVAGRIMSIRGHGGSSFLNVEDESNTLQSFFRKDVLGEKEFDLFKEIFDIGDFIEIEGCLFLTKTGEVTIESKKWRILSKSIRPLPDKWHGLKNEELKLRKRYLELIENKEFKKRIEFRSQLIGLLRDFMKSAGFMEVETPILQNQAGGALAKPFKTKLNALNIDLYLRIAPELHLKRLIIGGFEKIFELGKSFRNEGMDHSHNPEFTSMEFYWAYRDHEQIMEFTEEMFRKMLNDLPGCNELNFSHYFKKSLPRLEYKKIIKDFTGIDSDLATKTEAENYLKNKGFKDIKEGDKWTTIDEVYKKICLSQIDYPFFLVNHPLDLSPLAKENNKDKTKSTAARFQLIINKMEIVNAYAELNDPLDQKSRFAVQQERIKEGEHEAHPCDNDFVEALEYGMPPTAGWGMGIDRLMMLLTNVDSIKEVMTFPLIRPKEIKKDQKHA